MPIDDQKFFGPQHWNAIAKDIRLEYDMWRVHCPHNNMAQNKREILIARRALEELALRFAKRFAIDNYSFEPVKWLNQCSPDVNLYPLGELWHD